VTSARAQKPHADHYSYAVYADAAMAEAFDAARFGGPIGRLIAESQERVVTSFLAPLAGRSILDVGTGTGRAAILLARGGAIVTGVDASDEMLAVARRRALDAGVSVTFDQADAHRLSYADRAFDHVVCLRVLMHTPGWREALGELCRIARDRVVFDYPAMASGAALQAVTRRIACFAIDRLMPRCGRTASGSAIAIVNSCSRLRCTSAWGPRPRPRRSKGCLRSWDFAIVWARR
jgi:SAM-dependent methyltransferase